MLEELRAEYQAQTMGPLILKRVRGLVETQLRHRDPMIYANGSRDYRDGLDDVLQEFAIRVLLGEGQLAYIFDVASTADEFDRLANYQLRRFLARSRQRSIVDNLFDRSVRLMAADGLVVVEGEGGGRRFKLQAVIDEVSIDHRESALALAASVAANAVPKIYSNPDERNPKVYSDHDLRTLLRIFLAELKSWVGKQEIQRLFEFLLTPWTSTVLGLDEAVGDELQELTPEEQVMVNSIAEHVTAGWSPTDVVVFRYKLGNLPDAQLAERLGVSRPTAANEKARLFGAIRQDLQGIDLHLQPAVLTAIARITGEVSL